MKKVLGDHKLVNKKLQPPIFSSFDNWNAQFIETSYIEKIVPEIIWIAILNEKLGVPKAAEITLDLVKKIDSLIAEKSPKCFSFISNFELLNSEEKAHLSNSRSDSLSLISYNLQPFLSIFPNCPLNFFTDENYIQNKSEIEELKELLQELNDKRSKVAVFALSNVIYHLFELGRLKVTKESSLLQLNLISDYPNTYESKKIASAIRASLYPIIQNDYQILKNSTWINNFWNQAFKLEPYVIDDLYFD